MDKNAVFKDMEEKNVKFVVMQFSDLVGASKSITIPAERLEEAVGYGVWFDGSSIEGFARIHESDMFLRPDVSTYAVVPWLHHDHGNTARFICDVFSPDGKPFEGDPRYILKKTLGEAEGLGYGYFVGPELEFFMFRKENGRITPLPHDNGGYFDFVSDKAYEIRREMTNALKNFGIVAEAAHHEVAVGQHEIDFRYDEALRAADNTATMKYVLKAIAEKYGLHVTFMPKPIAGINGTGMHVHQSFFSGDRNAFYDSNDRYGLSEMAYQFIAGQLAHAKGMSVVLGPTVNSYKRLVPGYEAPVYVAWARINRSALIRIPRWNPEKPNSARCELRCPDPSANPYLAFAVMLKAGLDGIKNGMTPPEPVEENLFHFDDKKLAEMSIGTLPESLGHAIKEAEKDTIAEEAFGQHTYEKYLKAKKSEWDEYRQQVTQWELDNYLERY